MLRFVIQLAAADNAFTQNVKNATDSPRFDGQDTLVAISIGVGIGALLFVWAYLRFRKKPEVVTRSDSPREAPVTREDKTSVPSDRRRTSTSPSCARSPQAASSLVTGASLCSALGRS